MASFTHLDILCVTRCSFMWWIDEKLLWFTYFDSVDRSLALRTLRSDIRNRFCLFVSSIWKWKLAGHCQMASQPGRGTFAGRGGDSVITRHSGVFLDMTAFLVPPAACHQLLLALPLGCLLHLFSPFLPSWCYFLQPSAFLNWSRQTSCSASFASNLFQGWCDKMNLM